MDTFGARDLRRGLEAAALALREASGALDALNVYPVPDGDTGSNLRISFESVIAAASAAGEQDTDVAAAIRAGALRGAHGNSGVIVAQILVAFAEAVERGPLDTDGLAAALKRAVELAYAAVLEPAEGTILTVLRAAADAAAGAREGIVEQLAVVARAAVEAVDRTPDQMEVLRRAGVVDAGAAGLAVVFGAIARACGANVDVSVPLPRGDVARAMACEGPSFRFGYEVMYGLEAPERAIEGLRDSLGSIGDSVAVVGVSTTWRVHVHTDDTARAVALGEEIGRVSDVSIVSFAEQIAAPGSRQIALARADEPAVLIVEVRGEGNRARFEDLGARVVSGDAIADAVAEAREAFAIVLTTSGAGAERAGAFPAPRVAVLAADGPGAALAAAVAYTHDRPAVDVVADMQDALTRVRTAAADRSGIAREAALLLGAGGELLTVVCAAGVDEAVRDEVARELSAAHPGTTIEVLDGGQPPHPAPFVLAVE